MEVEFRGTKKKIGGSGKIEVGELLRRMKIARETVVVKRNGRIVPENEKVGGKDDVEIIQVVFGG